MKIGLLGVCFLACLHVFAQDVAPRLDEQLSSVSDSGLAFSNPRPFPTPPVHTNQFPGPAIDEQTAAAAPEDTLFSNIAADSLEEQDVNEMMMNDNAPFLLNFGGPDDLYLSQAGWTLHGFGFRSRGYDASQMAVYVNGALMNDLTTGVKGFGLWAGLNTAFRNHRLIRGLKAGGVGFGGLAGSNAFDLTAASQQKERQITYAMSNAGCRNSLVLRYCTGWLSNGWRMAGTLSKRWSKTGHIPGTFYGGNAYYLAISRKLGAHHSVHFTSFGSAATEGLAKATTLEAMDLAGSHYYNPAWGYQEGDVRNAKVLNCFQPVFLLNYKWEPDTGTKLNIVAGFQTGYSGNSGLDWYNAQDPRPDYYRNLPGYYLYNPTGPDPQTANAIRQEWYDHPAQAQVNWNRMYEVNRLNWETVNGVSGKRSLYVVGADREDSKKYSLDAHFQKNFQHKIGLQSGLRVISQQTERYRKMLDLLGGDYFVDLNQFAERTYLGNNSLNQQDLNHPDRLVRKGDKYNYHYLVHCLSAQAFSQLTLTFDQLAFFLAGSLESNSLNREGLYKNGLFPNNSYGKSEVEKFLGYKGKAGIQYSLSSGHTLFVQGAYGRRAPSFDAVFYAPRNRNATLSEPVMERFLTAEGGYTLHLRRIRAQITVYAGDMYDKTEVLRYYDESYRNFVNYVMQGIDIRHTGVEMAFWAKLLPHVSAGIAASWMQVFYTSGPAITVYPDNDTASQMGQDKVYWENYYAGSGPQSAYTVNLKYWPVRHGYLSARASYLHRAYVTLNPARHTENALELVPVASEQWYDILKQEQLLPVFTIDLTAGKSFDLKEIIRTAGADLFLHVGIGVTNILNNQNMQVSGYQQLRFDYATRQPERFPNKYRYGYGRTWYANVSLQF